MATLVDKQRAIFNSDQAAAFDTILESVTNNQNHLFFIHAAGGCGKTFLCNTIAAEVRRRGQIALCVVSSGIAALLLDKGRTSYSCFKIPLSIHEDSVARCQGRTEQERSEWSRVTLEWKGFDNKSGGTTLASACTLCLDRLSRVWLRISGGRNCCQESRRGVV